MIAVLALAFTCAVLHRLGRKAAWSDPAMIHAGIWIVASGSHVAFAAELVTPPSAMIAVVMAGVAAFSTGIWVGSGTKGSDPLDDRALPDAMVALLATIAAAGTIALLVRAQQLVATMPPGPWFWALRNAVTEGGQNFGVAAYLANAGFAAAFVAVLLARGRAGVGFAAVAVAFAVANAVLLTGRTFVLLTAVLLGVALTHRPWPPLSRSRSVMALAVLMLAVGIAVTVLQARNATDLGSVLAALRFEWMNYVPSGLAAFGVQVAAGAPELGGLRTFRTPLAVLKALGFDVTVVSLVQPFVPVPFSTNVYTALSPYYDDFGLAGVVVAFALLGLATGLVAGQARGRHPVVLLLHAILLYALFMQFFQDQYVSLASQWVQLLAIGAVFAWPARRTS
ncbi:MAG: oligosaccharide repeat unit polymerase [Alphaproteobacteria bacterium]|nr:oligosaccharide repeat unit polymerase [Alphaproteobacteria bacterium]